MAEIVYLTESLQEFIEATRSAAPKDWKCQECGKLMTQKQAEKAMYGDSGCPKCGGADIDLADTATYPRRQRRRGMAEAKAKTYAQAQKDILAYLDGLGWTVKGDLKVSHATSRDQKHRLYFKAQAVYLDTDDSRRGRFSLNNARSMWVADYRSMTPEEFYQREVLPIVR